MNSFPADRRSKMAAAFPATTFTVGGKAAAAPAAAAPKAAAKAAKAAPAPAAEEEEDEFDLFGSDDEDDAELEARVKAAQEKIDAKNQVKGKVLIAKSALTLDVKPWEVRQHY